MDEIVLKQLSLDWLWMELHLSIQISNIITLIAFTKLLVIIFILKIIQHNLIFILELIISNLNSKSFINLHLFSKKCIKTLTYSY